MDPFGTRELKDLEIEAAEARAVIEGAQMRELMAQGETGFCVAQAYRNPAFPGTHPLAALHAGRFRSDFLIREPKVSRKEAGMHAPLLDQRRIRESGPGGRRPLQTPHVPP